MIGYKISREDLEARIEVAAPGWLKKAAARTEKFRKSGVYNEQSSIWSVVKHVYMKLQGDCKCVFCERKLEAIEIGKVEQDVEHFRPKGRIRKWELPKHIADKGIIATEVPKEDRGYYLLPYNPFNYAASCKPCNSILKSDYFPVAGDYNLNGDDPKELLKEKPFLIYPISDIDKNPEELIQFYGVSPQPVAKGGHDRARALVTIEFFKLDDETQRKNLIRERAMVIVGMYPQLENMKDGKTSAVKKVATKIIEGFTAPSSPHTNCARCFKKLFEKDQTEAAAIFERASDYFISIS